VLVLRLGAAFCEREIAASKHYRDDFASR